MMSLMLFIVAKKQIMKNTTITLSLLALLCCCISSFAQEQTFGNLKIIQNPDGSVTVKGLKGCIFKDAEGTPTTEAALDKFLEANSNYRKQVSWNGKTCMETISAEKMYEYPEKVIGKQLVMLTYTDINGREIQLIDGIRPYLLCFWDTLCGNCIQEIKILDQLAREFPELQIVAITSDPLAKVETFLKDRKLYWDNIAVVTDYQGEYLPVLQSKIHPTTVLVSKSGIVENIYIGNDMRQMIVDMDSISSK